MPGHGYAGLVRGFWLVYSGIKAQIRDKVPAGLPKVIDAANFPPTKLDRSIGSESSKIL